MHIDFMPLHRFYKIYKDDVERCLIGVFERGSFVEGEEVYHLREDIKGYLGVRYFIPVASGSDALRLSLEALGIKGKKVITTPYSFISPAEAILHAGGEVEWVDVGSDFLIDPEKIEDAIDDRTCGIIPVHLFGKLCDMDRIVEISKEHSLFIVEDCAQAFGTKGVGRRGICGCFSFYPTKTLGGFGDGGGIATNDEKLAWKVERLRVHGFEKKYISLFPGYNSRLDEIQAALLRIRLRRLDKEIERRKEIERIYTRELKGLVRMLEWKEDEVPSLFPILLEDERTRDRLKSYLERKSIDTAIYYPLPLHLQPVFREGKGRFPVAEELSRKVLFIPFHPYLEDEEIYYVIENLKRFFTGV